MLTIDIYHQQFTEAFSALRANLADLQPVLHDIGVGLEGRVSVRVGFDKPYAVYHEWGTKHMKRRGMLTANPDTGELAPRGHGASLRVR